MDNDVLQESLELRNECWVCLDCRGVSPVLYHQYAWEWHRVLTSVSGEWEIKKIGSVWPGGTVNEDMDVTCCYCTKGRIPKNVLKYGL